MNENISAMFEKVYATASTAGDVASIAFDSAGRKAGEVYNTSKLRIKMLNIRTDMDILFKEAGKLVWAEHCDEEIQREKLQAIMLTLDEKKTELEKVSEELEEARGIKHCQSCGEPNPRKNAFCASCGNEL